MNRRCANDAYRIFVMRWETRSATSRKAGFVSPAPASAPRGLEQDAKEAT